MYLNRDNLVNMYLMFLKIISAHNLFNCLNDLYVFKMK